jgi:uncharacterized OB-fold protein
VTDERPVPAPTALSAEFWKATEHRRLVMQRCASCRRIVWYPRYICPGCGSRELPWEELGGHGVIYAVSVHHRSPTPALAGRTPYSVVLVDLDEGARMMSNVFGTVASVGDRVTVAWEPLADGRNLPVFEPR